MTLAKRLEKYLYKRKYLIEDRFKQGLQPFYYYYLTWQPSKYYTESYVLRNNQFFNHLLIEQLNYIKNSQDSFRCMITGIEGCGKTMLGLEIAHLVRDWDMRNGRIHLTYGAEGFCELFERGEVWDNDVVVADEMKTKYEGEGSKKIEWRLENIKTVNRKRRIHYVFISTDVRKFFTTLAEFKICGRDPMRQETSFLLYLGEKLIGKCFVKIRDLVGYQELDRQKKDEFIKRIEASGGAITLNLNTCTKREAEIALKLDFSSANIQGFIVDNAPDDELKMILRDVFNRVDQTAIADKLGVSQCAISKRLRTFGESLLGFLAEKYFQYKFDDARKLKSRAPQGEPDVIGADGKVYSIKCYMNYKNSQIIYPVRDCAPELKYCQDHGLNKFTVIFVNPIWGDGYFSYDVDVSKVPNWVSFNRDGSYKTG